MSGCNCENSERFRVTGEVIDAPATGDSATIGTGSKRVRIRCSECGGKVAYIGSDLLNVLGIPNEKIYSGACIGTPDEPAVTLTVDLI
jgi:hypothetical protein